MAELEALKTAVKGWERAFKREHGRAPTKADMKADPGDIEEQYAQWSKLNKAEKAKAKERGAQEAQALEKREWTVRRNGDRHEDRDEPGTPTPRRSSAARLPSPPPPPALGFSTEGCSSSFTNKRPPPSTPQSKRSRRRFGDDTSNPFSVTPKRASTSSSIPVSPKTAPFMAEVTGTPKRDKFESPFLHISTPRQLKALLEASSASRRAAQNSVKDTPRTHARRRLAGEVDSPVKARKRRGHREEGGFEGATLGVPEEDELGETPLKGEAFAIMDDFAPQGKEKEGKRDLFAAFRRAADEPDKAKGRVDGRDKGKRAEKRKEGEKSKKASAKEKNKRKAADTQRPTKKARSSSIPSGNPEDAVIPSTPPPAEKRSRRTPQPTRVLELSDDEWDPEAGPRTLRIAGTRRAAIAVRDDALASDDESGDVDSSAVDSADEEVADGEGREGGNRKEGRPDDTRNLLSLLSLRSPIARAGERMADLRVRALLDPTSAAAIALRAARRGQDVFACGEGVYEEDFLEIGEVEEVEGDDDWESDPEGWKATPGEDDW